MEITEQVYEGVTPSKSTARADTNRASHSRERKGGEDAWPTKLDKGRTGKRKKIYAGNQSDIPTGDKKYVLHGPGHSMEDWKVLKE